MSPLETTRFILRNDLWYHNKFHMWITHFHVFLVHFASLLTGWRNIVLKSWFTQTYAIYYLYRMIQNLLSTCFNRAGGQAGGANPMARSSNTTRNRSSNDQVNCFVKNHQILLLQVFICNHVEYYSKLHSAIIWYWWYNFDECNTNK